MDFDPRDRDSDVRDFEMLWVDVGKDHEHAREPEGSRSRDEPEISRCVMAGYWAYLTD